MGLSVEQGSFAHAIDHAVAAAAGFDARRQSSRKRGRLRGLGYACFLETSRGQPNEVAEVRVGDDGRIDLMVGTHSNGQGHETTFAQIAADAFGLPRSASGFGRAIRMISTPAAGMAGRARCIRAAPHC